MWLPKAHVEAPVRGSMILAGILLKLGGFGIMKVFSLVLFPPFSGIFFLIRVNLLGSCVIGFMCLILVDVKSLIAYSSVVHIGLIILGILRERWLGILGAMRMILAHGIRSPGIFGFASLNYEKTFTRNLLFQKGIFRLHPMLSFFWFLLLSANISAPPSLNLLRELFVVVRMLKFSFYLCVLLAAVTFFGGAYNLYLFSAQQGNSTLFTLPRSKLSSKDFLFGFRHILPVFLLTFFFYFIVWKGSLFKIINCDLIDGIYIPPFHHEVLI